MEIIPKPIRKLPAWQNGLLYLSLAILAAVVFSIFLLNNSLKNSRISLEYLERTLAQQKTPAEVSLEEKILTWQKKIKDFSPLLEKHLYPSAIFDFLGSLTHPLVWLGEVNLDLRESKAAVSGQTESFTTLGQQLLIFGQKPQIKTPTLSSLSIGQKGKVDFVLTLFLDRQLFKK